MAARVPVLAAEAFDAAGCKVNQEKTEVWVPAGLCPEGSPAAWWRPGGLRVLGAPAEGETPLAALGDLGAVVGDDGLISNFLDQAFSGYLAFVGNVVGCSVEADRGWSRVQAGAGLLHIQTWLGHKQVVMTQRYSQLGYAQLAPHSLRDAANLLERANGQ